MRLACRRRRRTERLDLSRRDSDRAGDRIAADGEADLRIFHDGRDNAAGQWSLVVALGAALGTQILSTASRGLWSQTWQILLLGVLIVDSILVAEHRGTRAHPLWLATLVAWVLSSCGQPDRSRLSPSVSTCGASSSRENFIAYAADADGWLAAFVGYSWSVFGTIDSAVLLRQPLQVRRGRHRLVRQPGESGARPVRVRACSIVRDLSGRAILADARAQALGDYWVRERRPTCDRDFNSSRMVGRTLLRGARLFTDVIPWFVLLAILGLDAMRRTGDIRRRRMELAARFLLLAIGRDKRARRILLCRDGLGGGEAARRPVSGPDLRLALSAIHGGPDRAAKGLKCSRLSRERHAQRVRRLALAFFALVETVGEADEAVSDAFVARARRFDAGRDEALGKSLAFVAQRIVASGEDQRRRQALRSFARNGQA